MIEQCVGKYLKMQDDAPGDTKFRVRIESVEVLLARVAQAVKPGEDKYLAGARALVLRLIARRLVAPIRTADGELTIWVRVLGLYTDPDGVDESCEALVSTPHADAISRFGGKIEMIQ